MLPPCQERWAHEVPREGPESPLPRAAARHRLSGDARINITFRMDVGLPVPLCDCGERATMKCRIDDRDGACRYYFTCNARSAAPCRFHRHA